MRAGLGVVALLLALGVVAWRQNRALQALAELEQVRVEHALTLSEHEASIGLVERLESRARVVPEARERLDMHIPDDGEMVILGGEGR